FPYEFENKFAFTNHSFWIYVVSARILYKAPTGAAWVSHAPLVCPDRVDRGISPGRGARMAASHIAHLYPINGSSRLALRASYPACCDAGALTTDFHLDKSVAER